MFKTLRNAFKVKDIRDRLIFTLIALLVVRVGTLLPAPVIKSEVTDKWFNTDAFSFVNSLTGGSFRKMSIFALSITPYITASIIIQLLTIAIPKLEEMHKEGEDGRKKLNEITRYMTVGLAVIESAAMAIGFGRSGYLDEFNFTNVMIVVAAFTAGSAFLMWVGERITVKGVGNGISIILTINIISRLPADFVGLFQTFVIGHPVINAIVAILAIVGITVACIVFVVLLQGAMRKIPVTYAKKVVGRKTVGGQTSHIPLKVNTSGVIPVIFSNSLMSFPIVISSFWGIQPAREHFWPKVLMVMNQNSWFNIKSWGDFKYTIGVVIYIVLTVFFAYFYTSITFNPIEVSNNIKKQGGFIPGIRPGKPTTEYLTKVLNYVIFIGAIGLTIAALIPIVFSGLFSASFSFGGTSLIIIVGVIVETIKQIESQLLVRHYKGFLTE
jgi:preprotein translocase, SecY subunit